MRLRRRRPEPGSEQFEEETREAEQYEFDDARHFASGRRSQGESGFSERGLSHEERMRDDDSRMQFQSGHRSRDPRAEPEHRERQPGREPRRNDADERREGYYGSGGSYGYGGGFEHDGRARDASAPGNRPPAFDPRVRRREPDNEYRRGGELGSGNEEFYEATGGFGYDTSAYGREGFGYPGRGENRGGSGPRHDARGYFDEHLNRPMPGRGYFNEDLRQGFSQNAGYWQSGGDRVGASGYGRSVDHADARGHEGGGRGSHDGPRFGQEVPRSRGESARSDERRFDSARDSQQGDRANFGGASLRARTGRMPRGYKRADERIREDVCDQLGHGEVDPSEITVTVREGVVSLEGTVGNRYEKFHVEEIAAAVSGVVEVENRVRVRREGQRDERRAETGSEPRESQQGTSREAPGKAGRNGIAG